MSGGYFVRLGDLYSAYGGFLEYAFFDRSKDRYFVGGGYFAGDSVRSCLNDKHVVDP